MNQFGLSDYMEKLKRTQELPVQTLEQAVPAAPAEALKMPELGASFKQQQAQSLAQGPSLAGVKPAGDGVSYDTAKAAVDTLAGTINAYAQGLFLAEEGRKEAAAKGETLKAKGTAQAELETGRQQFGGLSNLMDAYRDVYRRKRGLGEYELGKSMRDVYGGRGES